MPAECDFIATQIETIHLEIPLAPLVQSDVPIALLVDPDEIVSLIEQLNKEEALGLEIINGLSDAVEEVVWRE
jgi:hypothetical protein